MNGTRLASALAATIGLALAACGPGQSSAAPSELAPPASAAPQSAAPSPTLPDVPDFRVVAYQGDEAFGGHDGHFSAVFAAGRPVVLLYFAGL